MRAAYHYSHAAVVRGGVLAKSVALIGVTMLVKES